MSQTNTSQFALVQRHRDTETLASLLCSTMGARVKESLCQGLRVRIAVAGGSAASLLPALRDELAADWQKVELTWVDERCVPFESPQSNRGEAYRKGYLSDTAPVASELPLWLDDYETPSSALADIERRFVRDFDAQVDFTLMGLGEDGHIASHFPGHGPLQHSEGRHVDWVSQSPKPPSNRITLSKESLAACPCHFLWVSGVAKRKALNNLLRGDEALFATSLGRRLHLFSDIEAN